VHKVRKKSEKSADSSFMARPCYRLWLGLGNPPERMAAAASVKVPPSVFSFEYSTRDQLPR